MADKIRITWDELHSSDVDAKLKQSEVLARAQEHTRRASPMDGPTPARLGRRRASIWYNSLFYMAVFGLGGGIVAWAFSEFVFLVGKTNAERMLELIQEAQALDEQMSRGRITRQEYERRIRNLEDRARGNPYFEILTDSRLSNREREARLEVLKTRDERKGFIIQMLFLAILGITVAVVLAIAEPIVMRNMRAVFVNGSVAAGLGLAGGILVSLFINALYQGLGGGQVDPDHEPKMAVQMFARTVGWGVLGLFLSVAPGIVMRNWKKLIIGLFGGLIGGLLGGLLFDPIGMGTNSGVLSRFVAIVVISLTTAVATGLIEAAAKSGWLRVIAGLITGKQFILYRNPTYVGSSPICEVYLFKDSTIEPQHAAIHLLAGGFEIEDMGSASGTFVNGRAVTRTRLQAGDQIQIGSTCFQFQERERGDG